MPSILYFWAFTISARLQQGMDLNKGMLANSVLGRRALGWEQTKALLQKNSLPWVFIIGGEPGCMHESEEIKFLKPEHKHQKLQVSFCKSYWYAIASDTFYIMTLIFKMAENQSPQPWNQNSTKRFWHTIRYSNINNIKVLFSCYDSLA